MKISKYIIETNKIADEFKLAVVSDLHSRAFEKVIDTLEEIRPDAVMLPGDIVEIAAEYMNERNRNGLDFLGKAANIAPCYYCYGNHEMYYSHAKSGMTKRPEKELAKEYLQKILSYGIHVINDSFERLSFNEAGDVFVGGLVCGRDMDPVINNKEPDLNFLKEFDEKEGFKVLLCHYPHYYEKYLKNTDIDLVLSGHAHGGQWRIFGRGVYAPHQGLFPKYTSGIHDGRHIISRGVVNNAKPIPRLFNSCEVLEILIKNK